MLDHTDRRQRRWARMRYAYVPPLHAVDSLKPDDEGKLQAVDRQEALSRKLIHYTSHRLTPYDKVFLDENGKACVIRYTSNALTGGEAKLLGVLSRHRAERQREADAAIGRVS